MASDLFGDGSPVETWRSHASLWKSQLTPEAWSSLVHGVAVVRTMMDGRREIELMFVAGVVGGDLGWSFFLFDGTGVTVDVIIEARFLCERISS